MAKSEHFVGNRRAVRALVAYGSKKRPDKAPSSGGFPNTYYSINATYKRREYNSACQFGPTDLCWFRASSAFSAEDVLSGFNVYRRV